jgi:hypothetical protein
VCFARELQKAVAASIVAVSNFLSSCFEMKMDGCLTLIATRGNNHQREVQMKTVNKAFARRSVWSM